MAATKLTKYYVVIEVDYLRTGYRKFRANAENEQSMEYQKSCSAGEFQFGQEFCPAGEYLHSERLWMVEKVSAALNTTPTTIPQTPHISKNPPPKKKNLPNVRVLIREIRMPNTTVSAEHEPERSYE